MVTPYDAALRIDRDANAALVDWYIAHGADGLYANCLTSEMYLQDDAERLLLVRVAVTTAAGRVPVAATGNLGDAIEAQIALCRRVADAGADVVMLVVPEFHDNDADLERYYLAIADQVDAPQGTKYLLGKRGAPITPASRHPRSPLTANVVCALDYCAAIWFDATRELLCLRTT